MNNKLNLFRYMVWFAQIVSEMPTYQALHTAFCFLTTGCGATTVIKQLIFTQTPDCAPSWSNDAVIMSLKLYWVVQSCRYLCIFVKRCTNLDSPLRSAAGPVIYQPHLIGLTEIRCLDLGEILRPQLLLPLPLPKIRLRCFEEIVFILL